MKYKGVFGISRITDLGPLVSEADGRGSFTEDNIRKIMEPVTEDLFISVSPDGQFASLDFKLPLEPKREIASGVIVLRENEIFESTIRFPNISTDEMSQLQVRRKMENVFRNSISPSEARVVVPERKRNGNFFQPHIKLSDPVDMTIQEYAGWIERLTEEYDEEFPRDIRG